MESINKSSTSVKINKFIRDERSREVLEVIAKLGFVMFLSLAAPNGAGHIMKMLGWVPDYRNKYRTERILNSFEQKGLIKYGIKNGKKTLQMTEEGKSYSAHLKAKSIKLPLCQKWDGSWSIVSFDIPEKLKVNRKRFVSTLQLRGMFNLEKSMYIYPHECKDQISQIAELYLVSNHVRYIKANFIDRDFKAKKFFNLI